MGGTTSSLPDVKVAALTMEVQSRFFRYLQDIDHILVEDPNAT